MQTHAQVAGQHGQPPQLMNGGLPLSKKGLAAWRKPWHRDDNVTLRREIFSQITKLLQKHGLEKKLLEIAKDVEMALYLDATSKEEYGDLNTLEHRICSLMLRLRNGQKSAQQGVQPGSVFSKAPTPGCSDAAVFSSGSVTDASASGLGGVLNTGSAATAFSFDVASVGPAASFGSNIFASVGGQAPSLGVSGSGIGKNGQCKSSAGIPRAGSWMIPTPGLNLRNSEVSSNPAELAFSDGSVHKLSKPLLSTGSGGQYFGGGTGFQRGGVLSNNAQLRNIGMPNGVQVMGQEQGLVNGASVFHSSSNPKQGFVQSHPQYLNHVGQPLLQQQLCGVTGGDGYAIHATHVVEGNSFYNSFLPTGFATCNSSSLALTTPNSIPSMPAEQQDLKLSQSFPSQHSSQGGVSAQSSIFSILSRQQSGRSLVIPNQCGIVESDADVLRSHASPLRAAPDQCQLRTDQLSLPQAFETQGNQDVSWMERGAGKQCHLQYEPQKLPNPVQQGSCADQQVEHSEHACQASSADTGQSEVVSNDDSLAPSRLKEVGNLSHSQQLKRQQWLLIFLRHVSRCTDSRKCTVSHCALGRESWKHLTACQAYPCSYPRCMSLKWLLKHHQKCRNSKCAVCGPVRNYFSHQAAAFRAKLRKGASMQPAGTVRDSASNEVDSPPTKRVKVEALGPDAPKVFQPPLQSMSTVESQEGLSCQDTLSTPKAVKDKLKNSTAVTVDIELHTSDQGVGLSSLKIESPPESSLSAGSHLQENTKLDAVNDMKVESNSLDEDSTLQVAGSMTLQTDEKSTKQAAVVTTVVPFKGSSDADKPAKAKISGISYIESFSPQQIRQHISSLRKWIGQSKGKAERNQAMERQMLASACSACAVEDLYFDPIPNFCTQCGCRIKRNATYHSTGSGENSFSFCGPCYNAIRADMLETDGFKLQKSMLVKKKNDEQRVEGWVECDKCKKWQHQICVLFNARINKERSEYVCPECCIAEMERSERVPRPANSVPGAKDLPSTVLSDYIEERLALKLEQERTDRAKALGKSREEVLTAKGLVVRVISSVDKKLEVKPKFLELFQQEDYPKDFLYKSKMLMLFQEIEGVEVCLFGMYVQEFGAESPQPNHRWVYLSYLDSVKYFRPDVKTVRGEALRTYVYHEILIAYLDYCKKRGFSSCYIWACPPLKGDDYILYCHPEIQKTPKTDKLREWYLSMISKAKKEKVVVANKNLYDYFFTSNGDCKAKVTAARLPYFDGDYWPGAAEDILQQLQQEEEGLHSQRRGKTKKAATKRTTKTSAQAELAGNVSIDLQLMHKLGQSIVAMKEDFIMVHLHHACSRCRNFIISGHRWVCQQCAGNFQLCSSCYEEHQKLEEEERHPTGKKEWHPLSVVEEVHDVPAETVDRDEIMESEFFDNRQAFLSLCQGNQYQFDTLRRAKHSSMMVLYHLHNPNAPAFITSCTICHGELEAGQGWKCQSCTDFDVCHVCYSSQEVQRHPHKFVARSMAADLCAASKDLRKQRMLQLRMMLEVLVHASKCREASCQYAKCRNMKDLFRHGNSCAKRVVGGCSICKRMWFLLTAHARACKETVCTVPRCMDIRKHLRRTQLQQESRRRAAVNEMIRQRAAEAAGVQ